VRIDGPDFLAFLGRHPDVFLAVNASVAAKLRVATRRRVEFSTCSTSVRAARILAELGRAYGKQRGTGLEIAVPLTQAELATLAGTTEATLQRILSDFRREGLITTGYRRIVVHDEDGLSSRAEPEQDLPD
jgi:CRP-like cAMP-binding protein